jgi:hypothetical protein
MLTFAIFYMSGCQSLAMLALISEGLDAHLSIFYLKDVKARLF